MIGDRDASRVVVHVVEDLGIGGLERITVSLLRHLDPRRWRPHLVCTTGGGALVAEAERAGANVEILQLGDYYPGSIRRLARRFRALAPAVVHTHGHFAGVLGRAAAWWARVPALVHHLHTTDTTLRPHHARLERWLGQITSRTVACSRVVADHATLALGLDSEGIVVVPNGIDPPPEVSREAARAEIGNPETPVIGCVAALAPHKGQTVLLNAVARLASFVPRGTVVLVGDGPDRDRIETLARGLNGWKVLCTGARVDARRLLPAFDVAAVPSVDREGFGLAALEAMDAGCTVVASRTGGLPELIQDGRTGLLVRPDDPVDLAEVIRSVLSWPDRGRRLGVAARQSVESSYRATTMARRILSIYEEALDARCAA